MSDTQRDNLKRFLSQKGLSIKPLAKKAGIADGTVRSFLKGRTASLNQATLEKLAKAAGTTVDEILYGKKARPSSENLVAIKHLEVTASAGGGFEVASEPEGEPFYLRKEWVERMFGGHDGALRVIHFSGDSMLPTILDGDLGIVLTGTDPAGFQPGKIYVLWDGNGLVVKRLETVLSDRPRFRVISDNKALFEPYEIDAANARIVGRVLWRFGRL